MDAEQEIRLEIIKVLLKNNPNSYDTTANQEIAEIYARYVRTGDVR